MSEKCPECESDKVETHHLTRNEEYGVAPNTVTLVFEAPTLECTSCGLSYRGEAYETILEETIARYRRVFK